MRALSDSTDTIVATAMHAMPSPRPIQPMPSLVFPFTLTSSTLDAERRRETRAHQLAVRRRSAASRRRSRRRPAARASRIVRDRADGGAEHLDRVAALVGRIAIREHLADVARAGGAEDRVGDGVRDRVAVGMPSRCTSLGMGTPPRMQRSRRREAVRVVADADARIGSGTRRAGARRDRSRRGAARVPLGRSARIE